MFVSEGVQLNNSAAIILAVMIGVLLIFFILKRKQDRIKDTVDDFIADSEW